MLSENIKAIRKSKGLSQQELAVKLNVVRQTVSKWEQGLSVPDSDMLISISEALETPVSTLLGETVIETEADTLKAISEKLEVINLQLAQRKNTRRKIIRWMLISLCAVIVVGFAALAILNSPYLGWDYSDPETAVLGVAFHSLEWLFVRVAPIIFLIAAVGWNFPDTEEGMKSSLNIFHTMEFPLRNVGRNDILTPDKRVNTGHFRKDRAANS